MIGVTILLFCFLSILQQAPDIPSPALVEEHRAVDLQQQQDVLQQQLLSGSESPVSVRWGWPWEMNHWTLPRKLKEVRESGDVAEDGWGSLNWMIVIFLSFSSILWGILHWTAHRSWPFSLLNPFNNSSNMEGTYPRSVPRLGLHSSVLSEPRTLIRSW